MLKTFPDGTTTASEEQREARVMFAHLDTISTTKRIKRDVKMRDFERRTRLVLDDDSRAAEPMARTNAKRGDAVHSLRRLVNVVSFGIVGRLAPTR